MPAWAIPLAIQAAEALFVGIGTAYTVHQAGGDWMAALTAGIGAAVAKGLPNQLLGKKA